MKLSYKRWSDIVLWQSGKIYQILCRIKLLLTFVINLKVLWKCHPDHIDLLLTLFPLKTNIFVHSKNCTFSKKGLGHKGRCYSVCNDDTCKWTSHILSRIIGPSNTTTKIRVPISDTGHMAQISTANSEILINFHVCSCKVYSCSCKIYSCSRKIHAFPYKFMCIHAKFICVYFFLCSCKFYAWIFEVPVVETDNFGWPGG